ncbi:uncharacterized protein LOC141816203 [Curcuma longa]|uniref:uncharacterized protein LOC141816203 n=1 Tax=Curcuma longa TaxID=136217 RepID=UPI003D9F3EFD
MNEENSSRQDPNRLQMEALTQHFERMLQRQLEGLHERMDRLEGGRVSNHGGNSNHEESHQESDLFYGSPRERRRREGGRRHERGGRDYRHEDDLRGVKVKVPSFQGRNDPDTYLEWEMKIEQIFSCHNYNDAKKVKVAALEFTDYALIWWDQMQKERRRYGEHPINTWDEMKTLMRRRFVPSHYHRELHNKLQRLIQGSRSVDEYYKEMEVALIRANIVEDREATMARFLHGLNRDIGDIVELQHYVELEDLVHQAMKVEQQLKRKGIMKKPSSSNYSSSWKDKPKKEGSSSNSKEVTSTKKPFPTTSSSTSKSRDIKCFKCLGKGHIASECPNKKTMVVRDNGSISSEEISSHSSSSSDEEHDGAAYAQDGDLLVVRRLLGSQAKEHEEDQRENIFHTRCLIQGKTCSMIIDGGSCTNVASTRLVTKLNLKTTPHARPYKLQWLSNSGELVVNQQVLINFSIGKYEDQVLCDIVPMEASHILLGRPWQFDRRAHHDGFSNKFSFLHNSRKVTLVPLSPREDFEDVFPKEVPHGLPPIRGIEHQMDLIPGASLPNRPAYRSNPQETKEIQNQVEAVNPCDWVWVHKRMEIKASEEMDHCWKN